MSGAAATLLIDSAPVPPGWGPAIALNRADGTPPVGQAPEWIQLLPAGSVLTGRDGRTWRNSDPGKLVAAFNAHGAPVAIDYEHAQDHLAPKGIEAPAAAWIEQVELREGATWGRVEWTARAKRAVAAREYRFFSPAFTFDARSGEVAAIIGGALVNRPNFVMAALNSAAAQNQGSTMLKEVAAALGLPEHATPAECVMGIAQLKADKATALNAAQTPDLQKFVPRADLDAALNRATTAEGKLRNLETAGQESAITASVDDAIKAGKIAPASRDYYLGTCRAEGGLDRFKAHVATLPSHFAPSGLDTKDPNAGTATALNAEQKATCKAMGIPEDKFVAYLAERAKTASAQAPEGNA